MECDLAQRNPQVADERRPIVPAPVTSRPPPVVRHGDDHLPDLRSCTRLPDCRATSSCTLCGTTYRWGADCGVEFHGEECAKRPRRPPMQVPESAPGAVKVRRRGGAGGGGEVQGAVWSARATRLSSVPVSRDRPSLDRTESTCRRCTRRSALCRGASSTPALHSDNSRRYRGERRSPCPQRRRSRALRNTCSDRPAPPYSRHPRRTGPLSRQRPPLTPRRSGTVANIQASATRPPAPPPFATPPVALAPIIAPANGRTRGGFDSHQAPPRITRQGPGTIPCSTNAAPPAGYTSSLS